jgi:hypothetical protein
MTMNFGNFAYGVGLAGEDIEAARQEKFKEAAELFRQRIEQGYLDVAQRMQKLRERYGFGTRMTPEQEAWRAEFLGRATYGPAWDTMPDEQKTAWKERMFKAISPAYVRPGLEMGGEGPTGYEMVGRDPLTGEMLWENQDYLDPRLLTKKRTVEKGVPSFNPATGEARMEYRPFTETLEPELPKGKPWGKKAPLAPGENPQFSQREQETRIGKPDLITEMIPKGPLGPTVQQAEALYRGVMDGSNPMHNLTPMQRVSVEVIAKMRGEHLPKVPEPGGPKQAQQRATEIAQGLDVLHTSLFGNPALGAEGKGLQDYMSVLDEGPLQRGKLSALLSAMGFKHDNSYFSRLMPGFVEDIIAMSIGSTLTDDERSYIFQMQRAVGAIQALREVTGLPRSTQALMNQYVNELPEPRLANSSKAGMEKLGLIEREIKTALARSGLSVTTAPSGGLPPKGVGLPDTTIPLPVSPGLTDRPAAPGTTAQPNVINNPNELE